MVYTVKKGEEMGTDMMLFAEKRVNGKWRSATKIGKRNSFFENTIDLEYGLEEIIVGRNYYLFALLADVRNSRLDILPISLPKGLPEDCCKEIMDEFLLIEDGIYSTSWIMVSDLYKVNWDQVFQLEGRTDQDKVHLFKNNPLGFPYGGNHSDWRNEGIKVKWRATLGDVCNWRLLEKVIQELDLIPETSRLVFWFSD